MIAMYAGTFDPWTDGHQDVFDAAWHMFDKVIVAILTNDRKTPMFDSAQREKMVRMGIDNSCGVMRRDYDVVVIPDAAAVRVAAEYGAHWMVRGLRLGMEYEGELEMCLVNASLDPSIQTIYIPPRQKHIHISSTTVRTLIKLGEGEAVRSMVSESVYREICDATGLDYEEIGYSY
jgi:pantetheine-phosphate adenylyltransferase